MLDSTNINGASSIPELVARYIVEELRPDAGDKWCLGDLSFLAYLRGVSPQAFRNPFLESQIQARQRIMSLGYDTEVINKSGAAFTVQFTAAPPTGERLYTEAQVQEAIMAAISSLNK